MKRLKRKDLLLLATKLIEKIPDPRNAKEHHQLFLRKKNIISVKQSAKKTTFENPNIVDIISVVTKHSKMSHKLCKTSLFKTIRQAEKVCQVGSTGSLYSDLKKIEKFLNEKNVKITKWTHAFKGYASSYNVEISNSFNPVIQLKDTESAIKNQIK